MKKLFVLLLAFFVLSSCTKDEERSVMMGFNYDGNFYNLNNGFVHHTIGFASDSLADVHSVFLGSSGISFNEDDNQFIGNGHGIYIRLFPLSNTDLSGFYPRMQLDPDCHCYLPPFTNQFIAGIVMVDYDLADNSGIWEATTTGTVEVFKENNLYLIYFNNLLTADSIEVSGSWRGELIPVYL